MKKVTIGLLIYSLFFPVIAAEGKWIEGYGQGNLEYFIDHKGFRLFIQCPTQDGSYQAHSAITLNNEIEDSTIKQFTVTVNGFTYNGPFSADSRVGDNNFISFLENIKKGDAVVKFGKNTLTFPKSNAAEVTPTYGEDFYCNLG